MHHLAIMKKSLKLLPKILSKEKIIESRWYKFKRTPYNNVQPEDTIFLKNTSEPVTAKAKVQSVLQFQDLNPEKINQLLATYHKELGILPNEIPTFQSAFYHKKYSILIFLKDPTEIQPFHIDKTGYGAMSAWITLKDINHIRLPHLIKHFQKTLPKFPDGRIDYTNAKRASVVKVFLKHKNKYLLLKRSNQVSTYQNMWNTVAGYLDEPVPLNKKVLEELREEINLQIDPNLIQLKGIYETQDPTINKSWIIHTVLIELNQEPTITLDWEHTQYKWLTLEELNKIPLVTQNDFSLLNKQLQPVD